MQQKFGKVLINQSTQFEVLYHGCGAFYYDGTLPLISKRGGCSIPTGEPFWKDPEDVTNSVKTRSQKRVATFIGRNMIDAYFDYKRKVESRYEKYMNRKDHYNTQPKTQTNKL